MHISFVGRLGLATDIALVTRFPDPGEERPPAVVGACTSTGVLDPVLTHRLSALASRPDFEPEPDAADGPLRDLRAVIDHAVSSALAPAESSTSLWPCRLARDRPAGWITTGPDPAPCVATRAGWLTAVRVLVPLRMPIGAQWALHAPADDVRLAHIGRVAFVGPRVPQTLTHPRLSEPLVWLAGETVLRFPRHWAPPVSWSP